MTEAWRWNISALLSVSTCRLSRRSNHAGLTPRTVTTISGHVCTYVVTGWAFLEQGEVCWVLFSLGWNTCFGLCLLSRHQQPLFRRLDGNNLFFGAIEETKSGWTEITEVRGEKVLLLVTYQKQGHFSFPNLKKKKLQVFDFEYEICVVNLVSVRSMGNFG